MVCEPFVQVDVPSPDYSLCGPGTDVTKADLLNMASEKMAQRDISSCIMWSTFVNRCKVFEQIVRGIGRYFD